MWYFIRDCRVQNIHIFYCIVLMCVTFFITIPDNFKLEGLEFVFGRFPSPMKVGKCWNRGWENRVVRETITNSTNLAAGAVGLIRNADRHRKT